MKSRAQTLCQKLDQMLGYMSVNRSALRAITRCLTLVSSGTLILMCLSLITSPNSTSRAYMAPSLSVAEARDHKWGVGLILGWPSGIAGQVRLGRLSRLNAALSYDLRDPSVGGHLDQIFLSRRAYFSWFYPYIGWGGRLAIGRGRGAQNKNVDEYEWSGLNVGARLPLGVEVGRNRWRGLIELSPTLDLIPSPRLVIGASLGVRYHF